MRYVWRHFETELKAVHRTRLDGKKMAKDQMVLWGLMTRNGQLFTNTNLFVRYCLFIEALLYIGMSISWMPLFSSLSVSKPLCTVALSYQTLISHFQFISCYREDSKVVILISTNIKHDMHLLLFYTHMQLNNLVFIYKYIYIRISALKEMSVIVNNIFLAKVIFC